MMNNKILFPLLILILFQYLSSNAQITADFTANITQGCAPQIISFTNNSTPTSGLTYSWNFGNGDVSNLQNPGSRNYINPGVYTVTLIVSNGTTSDTIIKTGYITIHPKPNPNFNSLIHQGCTPLTVGFNNTSTLNGVPDNSSLFIWDFGDGDTIHNQFATHTYQASGNFIVSLTVIDTNNCKASYTTQSAIHINNPPSFNFISNNGSFFCTAPQNVPFTKAYNGTETLSYKWNFGDPSSGTNNISTIPNANHTYNNYGTYTVSLIAKDQLGCADTVIKTNYIKLTALVASYNIIGGSSIGFGGVTVCTYDTVFFNNTSSSLATSYKWNFGDGTTSTLKNPIHMFPIPGVYQITLISKLGSGCADTITKIITSENVVANFTSSPTYGCQLPFVVNFNASTSINAFLYNWRFGDYTMMSSSNAIISKTFGTNGIFSDTLIVTSARGCKDTVVKSNNDTLALPNVVFSATPQGQCIPFISQFTDQSTSGNDSIVSWHWDFANGDTSNLQNPIDSFLSVGVYYVTLTITNNRGCVASNTMKVKGGTHQNPNYSYTLANGGIDTTCAIDTVYFHNLSTSQALINKYEWHFGDGTDDTVPNPSHLYKGTGWMHPMLIVGYNGCIDTLLTGDSVYIKGPYVKPYSVFLNCDSPNTYYFAIESIMEANRWNWDFNNDTIIDTTITHPNIVSIGHDTLFYNYLTTGLFIPALTAYNDSTNCSFEVKNIVFVRNISASLSYNNDTLCKGSQYIFDATGSQDAFNFYFDYGNGNASGWTSNSIDTAVYPNTGLYNIKLIAVDANNCTDTISEFIKITKPIANFIADTLYGCTPFTVNFIDSSYSDVGLKKWDWIFGNGIIDSVQNPTFTYNQSGDWTTTLVVYDIAGCSDILTLNNFISTIEAVASYYSLDTVSCIGDSVKFSATSTGSTFTYQWNFGDTLSTIIQDTARNPVHFYNTEGVYNVTLTVYDNLGCTNTLVKSNYIQIQDITAVFSIARTDTTCYPFPINVTNQTSSPYNPTYCWDFGDGGIAYGTTTNHNYTKPGEFYLKLTATTSRGCKSSDSVKITVGGPYANIILSKDTICKGESIILNLIDTINLSNINWGFGDGSNGSSVFPVSHTYDAYSTSGHFTTSVIYCSDTSLTCCHSSIDTVNLFKLYANFSTFNNTTTPPLPDTSACNPSSILFKNISDVDTTIGGYKYYWNFDNGSSIIDSSVLNHIISYFNYSDIDTTFNIQLITININGCKDTIIKPFIIHPLPKSSIIPDSSICNQHNIQLNPNGDSLYTYSWIPIDYLNDSNSYNPLSSPDTSIKYIATITNIQGCSIKDSISIYVFPLDSISLPLSDTIFIGDIDSLILKVINGHNPLYSWSPDTGLSCTNCLLPLAQPLVTTTYKVNVSDTLHCFNKTKAIKIVVINKFTLDVPTAFTPGENINNVIYARGIGIKNPIEFNIFNRWGQMVFSTNDINVGWDGKFKGVDQPSETYTYYVAVTTYQKGKRLTKKGNIFLIR